ncbi:MAG TPA: ABC transporter permease [Alphaproteobacteria bacterium]|nr:ABC transporter permease [Alphaproteobacteria bacterium]
MSDAVVRFGRIGVAAIFGSVAIWALLLILIPHVMLIDYAFHANPGAIKKGLAGEGLSLYSFSTLFDPSDDLALRTFIRTLLTSGVITILALVVCYPLAYYLAKVALARNLQILMLCLLVPFWVNEVLRAFAWRSLMARQGLLNQVVVGMGLEPIEFFNYELPIIDANIALFVGLIYSYVLFMIFPMYNAMESLDTNQVEAARDLGASWVRVHRRIVIPHAKPGIASGCIVTFMLSAGSFIVPVLLGGKSSFWFTQAIESQFSVLNWNGGSAYALVLEVVCLIFVITMMRIFRVTLRDITR